MSFDILHIQLDKLSYRLQKWQLTKVFSVKRKLNIKTAHKTSNWEFTFELHLEHLGMQKTNHLVKVSRKSFKVNGKSPDYLISRITNEIQESLYPMVFSVDAFGRISEIYNFNEIKENWKTKKGEIQKIHEGHGLDLIIRQIESHLENKESFFQRIKYDASILGLFLPVYRNYGDSQKLENEEFEVYLPGIDKLSFKGELKYSNQNDVHFSNFKGNLILDEFTEEHLQNYSQKNLHESFHGTLTYERNTQSMPFLRQNIEIELHHGKDAFYSEMIEYQFLRILK